MVESQRTKAKEPEKEQKGYIQKKKKKILMRKASHTSLQYMIDICVTIYSLDIYIS